MSFLAPLMLIGALGLLVPIAIHLIGRRRAKVVRFAALEFLIGTRRRTARRLELRERLLLLVRAAVCLAVPLALAKPFTSCQTHGLSIVRGPQAAVLVVDDSFTAGYKLGDRSLLSRATAEAARILERLGPEAEVAVIRAAEGAPLPTELSRDHLRVRDALLALTPSSRPADLDRALSRAAQLLAGSNHQRRTVYLLAPLTVGSVHGGTPPWGADGPRLEIVDLRGDAALPNLAVTGLTVEPDASAGTRGVSVVAEIANHGQLPVHGLTVSLTIGNAVVARGQLDVAAGARQVKRFLATLPAGARSAEVMVEIPRDALPADDRRYALARLRDEIRVLVVDGDARADRREDEVFYLEAALRPGDRAEAGTVVTRITPDDLDDVHLDQFDVAILANVAALPAERVAALSQWVAAGGGLMVAAGDHVDPAAYEKTMTPLLPQAVRDPVDTGCASAPDECAARAWHLTKWEADHPIFAPFTQDAPGLAEASFDKVLLLGPTTDTADRKVLAHFTNGAAALVEARSGGGRLLLYTSTLDRDWNDLPLHPGFLPLMQEAVRHLARRRDEAATANLLVGQPASLPTLDLKRLEVHGPEGQGAVFAGDRLEGRRMIRFTATEAPGIYRVGGADQAGATRDRDELAFAVNLDPRGSDLTAVGPGALPPSGTSAGLAAHTSRRRVELWHALAAALLVLLLLESVLVQRR